VLFIVEDPDWTAMTRGWLYESVRSDEQHMNLYYRPAMRWSSENHIPIALRVWNWDNRNMEYDDWFIKSPDAVKPQVLETSKSTSCSIPLAIVAWPTW